MLDPNWYPKCWNMLKSSPLTHFFCFNSSFISRTKSPVSSSWTIGSCFFSYGHSSNIGQIHQVTSSSSTILGWQSLQVFSEREKVSGGTCESFIEFQKTSFDYLWLIYGIMYSIEMNNLSQSTPWKTQVITGYHWYLLGSQTRPVPAVALRDLPGGASTDLLRQRRRWTPQKGQQLVQLGTANLCVPIFNIFKQF